MHERLNAMRTVRGEPIPEWAEQAPVPPRKKLRRAGGVLDYGQSQSS